MINIETLKQMQPVINIKKLAEDALITPMTLYTKLKFNRELKVDESEKITQILFRYGLEQRR